MIEKVRDTLLKALLEEIRRWELMLWYHSPLQSNLPPKYTHAHSHSEIVLDNQLTWAWSETSYSHSVSSHHCASVFSLLMV